MVIQQDRNESVNTCTVKVAVLLSHISIYHKIQGPNATFCQNEISAETGMAYARSLLDGDVVDVVLVGGAEELSEILFGCYDAVGGLNKIRVNEGEAVHTETRWWVNPGGRCGRAHHGKKGISPDKEAQEFMAIWCQMSSREAFLPWVTMPTQGRQYAQPKPRTGAELPWNRHP